MAKKLAMLGLVVSYVGAVLGVTLLLSERAPMLQALAGLMLVAGIVAPLVLLARAARETGGKVALHVVPAIIFWPLGLVLAFANVLERCREQELRGQG